MKDYFRINLDILIVGDDGKPEIYLDKYITYNRKWTERPVTWLLRLLLRLLWSQINRIFAVGCQSPWHTNWYTDLGSTLPSEVFTFV